jgi:hypothetical protein
MMLMRILKKICGLNTVKYPEFATTTKKPVLY